MIVVAFVSCVLSKTKMKEYARDLQRMPIQRSWVYKVGNLVWLHNPVIAQGVVALGYETRPLMVIRHRKI